MNTEKLMELLSLFEEVEAKLDTQGRLLSLSTALSKLVSSPQDANHQSEMSVALNGYSDAISAFQSQFSPQDYERLLGISNNAFSGKFPKMIEEKIISNPISPKVASDYVEEYHAERERTFTDMIALSATLKSLNMGVQPVEEGRAEIGFQLPRALFDNNLEGLITELQEIKRIVRFFYETTLNEYSPPTVKSISTTDPLFFFETVDPVVRNLAATVTWCLGVWYGIEKIRNVRAETAKLQSFSPEEIEDIFDGKIKAEIDASVQTKVAELLEESALPKARKVEMSGQLTWALETLLAKIERGMVVELRIPPPTDTEEELEVVPADDNEGNGVVSSVTATVSNNQLLRMYQNELRFPGASDTPVLKVPKFKEPE